ncbi:hypothetical protein [Solibacillus sp. FSL H8-0538]|uniref:hypothetical protein n=1 Tax=Solibacillus sp. FSL H8-0538 TaxID=2921400 RepID=UPI0030F638A0
MGATLFVFMTSIVVSFGIVKFTLYQENKNDVTETMNGNLYSEKGFDDQIPDSQSEEVKTTESGTWRKVWKDTFDDANHSIYKWSFMEKDNNYNNELQFYKEENSQVQVGILHLTG